MGGGGGAHRGLGHPLIAQGARPPRSDGGLSHVGPRLHPGRLRSEACDTLRPEARPRRYLRLQRRPRRGARGAFPAQRPAAQQTSLKGPVGPRGQAGPGAGSADWRRRCPPDPTSLPPGQALRERRGHAGPTHVLGGAERAVRCVRCRPYPRGSTGRSGFRISFCLRSAALAGERGAGQRAGRCAEGFGCSGDR